MISRSVIIVAFLFIAFELFLRITDIPWDTSQNDKSANIISVQDYIYNYSANQLKEDTVIVGTSVSRKLITDTLGRHYVNLAFNAWNSFDGLELVKINGKKPSCILVETNYAKNQILQPEISGSLDPVSYYPGITFKSLQLRNQPTGLLIGWAKNLLKTRIDRLKEKKRENVDLYNFSLQMNKEIMNQPIPDSILDKRFDVIKSLIDGFKKDGVHIVFYEVPVDKELGETTSLVQVRSYFRKYFPENENLYIPSPAAAGYVFSDGVHLSAQSAMEYTLYLKSELHKK
jgi:hypothetical protein